MILYRVTNCSYKNMNWSQRLIITKKAKVAVNLDWLQDSETGVSDANSNWSQRLMTWPENLESKTDDKKRGSHGFDTVGSQRLHDKKRTGVKDWWQESRERDTDSMTWGSP